MDEILLHCLLQELTPRLLGARVEKAYQYGDADLAIRIWMRPERATLLVSAEAQTPAFALIDDEPAEPRLRSPLLEGFRARAVPSHITAVERIAGERIVTLELQRGRDAGAESHRLVIELLPRAPALFLLDGAARIIAAAGAGVPGKRGLSPGQIWRPPPPAPPPAPGSDPALAGLNRMWSREVLARAAAAGVDSAAARVVLEREIREQPRPSLQPGADGRWVPTPVVFVSLPGPAELHPDFRTLAAAWYARSVAGGREQDLRARLLAALGRRIERTRRTLDRVLAEGSRAESLDRDRERGELLLGYARVAVVDGDTVRVPDPTEAGAELRIPLLDARATLVENAQAYFTRYRTKQRAVQAVARRREELGREQSHLEELEQAVQSAAAGELPALAAELISDGLMEGGRPTRPQRKGRAPAARAGVPSTALQPRAFHASTGDEILVGRSSRGNDQLTFRIATEQDFWLHADAPGSHVVLRNRDRRETPDETSLTEAAELAAWYSKLRGAGKAEVNWTRCREVRRIPGGPPGQVTLKSHRSIRVVPARAARRFALDDGGPA